MIAQDEPQTAPADDMAWRLGHRRTLLSAALTVVAGLMTVAALVPLLSVLAMLIYRGGQRLERLVQDFMTLQHIEAGMAARMAESRRQKLSARRVVKDFFETYREDYKTYYETCKRDDSPAMRDSNPTVILIPGLGMIAWGKDKSESRVTAEFYTCAIEVMRGAEAIDEYIKLPQQEAFDIEYWSL